MGDGTRQTMDLRRLAYFVEACDRGSLTAASLAIDVAQPALSRQIRELEQEMGLELLHRTGRGVTPTHAGRHLLEGARRLLAESERLRDEVRSLAGATAGEAVIGMPPTVGRVLAVPLTRAVAARYPGLSLRIVEGFSGTTLEALQAGRIDLAILYDNPGIGPVVAERVAEEDLVVVGARADPQLAADATPAIADLATHPLVLPSIHHSLRQFVARHAREAGVHLPVQFEIDSLGAIIELVAEGLALTILPAAAAARDAHASRLTTWPLAGGVARQLLIATAARRPGGLPLQRLVALVREEMVALAPEVGWRIV